MTDAPPLSGARAVAPVRVYRQVADDLERRISAGEFKIGERLPTERALAGEYSVSRTCVREALLAMEIAGLVSIRVGSGVFVLATEIPQTRARTLRAHQHGPSELLEARLVIEPELAALAAARAGDAEIATIAEAIEIMREEHRLAAESERGDRIFHSTIASAAHNGLLQAMIEEVWTEMSAPMWQALQAHIRSPLLRLGWIEDHEAVLAALCARDRRRARSAMKAHIERVRDTLDKAKFL
ncbi:FCD domain-containing protein [Acuticoccus sp. MNP-M23]|uniref:FadR/GntR family transcriptional regulator n=1 Tax=Acuticoccus sp. MNP-M23 TaxID=3072793 RepID=UPI002816139B|nr:FCD domain-containing protein [Acuticoccus sp. MNP-M23]WMS41414.1 FCD domain-containing protein [Acuticoccus sp. MNP-M23]